MKSITPRVFTIILVVLLLASCNKEAQQTCYLLSENGNGIGFPAITKLENVYKDDVLMSSGQYYFEYDDLGNVTKFLIGNGVEYTVTHQDDKIVKLEWIGGGIDGMEVYEYTNGRLTGRQQYLKFTDQPLTKGTYTTFEYSDNSNNISKAITFDPAEGRAPRSAAPEAILKLYTVFTYPITNVLLKTKYSSGGEDTHEYTFSSQGLPTREVVSYKDQSVIAVEYTYVCR